MKLHSKRTAECQKSPRPPLEKGEADIPLGPTLEKEEADFPLGPTFEKEEGMGYPL